LSTYGESEQITVPDAVTLQEARIETGRTNGLFIQQRPDTILFVKLYIMISAHLLKRFR